MDTRTFCQTPLRVKSPALSSLYPITHLSYLWNIFSRLPPVMLQSTPGLLHQTAFLDPLVNRVNMKDFHRAVKATLSLS